MKGHVFLLIRLLEIASTLQEIPTFFFLHLFSSITEKAFVPLLFFL